MACSSLGVLHAVDDINISGGGSRKVAVELCANLGLCGATVHLISQERHCSGPDSNVPHLEHVKIHLVQLLADNKRWRVAYSPLLARKIKSLCRQESIEIIHVHGLWLPCNHTPARIARRLGIPLVISPHGMLQPWALSYRAWKKWIAWLLYQHRDLESAALFVAASEPEAEAIQSAGLQQPIAIIPNGIHLPAWKERSAGNTDVRYALFLSRIHPSKGVLNLVTAWDRVRPKGWRMIVAGPDEVNHRREVERAVKNAKLEREFEFVGPVEGTAKERLYSDVDLFILPTFSENFGIVVAEALSYGIPVITTHGAPWSSLLEHRCGWWVTGGVPPLADAISDATALSDTERHDMGRRGRKLVEKEFSWPEIASKMLDAYKWILDKGDKPSYIV